MKKILYLYSTLSLIIAGNAYGADALTVTVARNQAVVQVKGIVCSFCAHGTEKALSKLSFLDKSQFGDDGVLIDIHTHRIILALQSDRKLDVAQIYRAIKKGGYDPSAMHVNLRGQVRRSGDRFLLTCPDNGQVFEISGNDVETLVDKGLIQVTGQVDTERMSALESGQPIPVALTSPEIN